MRYVTLVVVLACVIWSGGTIPDSQAQEVAKIPIEAEADELEYDGAGGWIHARGNVTIKKGGQIRRPPTGVIRQALQRLGNFLVGGGGQVLFGVQHAGFDVKRDQGEAIVC